jgi:hypothetical protein
MKNEGKNIMNQKNTKPFQLYQLREGADNALRRFMGYDWLRKSGLTVEPARYCRVYQGETAERTTLDDIFERFNNTPYIDEWAQPDFDGRRDHKMPHDYHARSLSVSDLIVMDGKCWYVDSFGFKDVTGEVGGVDACSAMGGGIASIACG